jgi:hypothetical protein
MKFRGVIACLLTLVVVLGPLAPRARAQEPAPPAPMSAPPGVVVEVVPPERPMVRGTDIYDVGANVVTAAKIPFNVALCTLGAAAGTALFLMTLGSSYKASTRAVEEGCAQRWVIRGDDIRPRGGVPGIFSERPPSELPTRR